MDEKSNLNTIIIDSKNSMESPKSSKIDKNCSEQKYFNFFEYSPISLWIEDFSKTKKYIDKLALDNKTTVKKYIKTHPEIVFTLASMVTVKEVNRAAVKMYKAKNKQVLLENLTKVFTPKSNEGFAKLVLDLLLGVTETEIESENKTFTGEIINTLVKFKVVEGFEDTLENVIVSVEDITDIVIARKNLLESETRYKQSQSLAKIGNWSYDFHTQQLHWSDEVFKILDLSKSENNKISLEFYLSFVHKDDLTIVNNFSINSLKKHKTQNIQYRIITKKGTLKYISEKRSVLVENKNIIKVIGVAQDITESVTAAQQLNITKNVLSNTLSSIKDGFVILNKDSKYVFVNEKAVKLLGKKAENLLGKNIWDEFPEKEGDLFYDNYQKALKTNTPISFENYFKPWNKWFENRIIPSNDGILIFFHETTQEKESQNKIKEAYNIINKSSSVAVLCKNERDFPVVFASENSKKLFGYSSLDFLSGKIKIHQIVYPKDLDYIRTEVFKLSKSKTTKSLRPKPFRILTKSNQLKWIQASIDTIRNNNNEITHIQGIVEDITERKKTEDLFFESSQRLKDQFDNTPLASIIWDLNFKVVKWNDSAERIFGYTAKEAIGKSGKDLLIPADIIHKIETVWQSLLNQEGGYRHTNKSVTKKGNTIVCDWYNVTLKDSNGNVTGVASMGNDITETINSKKLLEKSEKKYRAIFEKSVDGVFILKNNKFVDCNKAALKLFGCSNKEKLLQIHPSNISPELQPDGRNSFEKAEEIIKIAKEKGSNRFVWYHKKINGRVFPAEVTITKIEENTTTSTLQAVIRDITDKVKQQNLEQVLYTISNASLTINSFEEFSSFVKNQLHKIIDTTNFYIALYNKESDMISTPFISDEMEDFSEFPAKNSLTGHVIKTKKPLFITSEEHQKMIEKGEVAMVGFEAKIWIGVPLILKDEAIGAIVVQSYSNKNAYSLSDVHLLEFVSDQISTAIQRIKFENELKDALHKAQESDRLKTAFLANMSHEIRTPMNGIIGFSELFLEDNLNEVQRKEYAKIVINSSKQLLAIVNDILDISKIEAGALKLNYEKVNINKLIDEITSFYLPVAKENNILFTNFKGLDNMKSVIEIDKTKLNQVLTNLLSNAFKFTDKGSIQLGYNLIDDKLQFYVKDTGIGIKQKLQEKIFDRFTQANVVLNKKHKGTGLGLAISKKLVEMFKGEIWIQSNTKGTTVNFTIPYKKATTKLITTVVNEKKPNMKNTSKEFLILVAEDEEYNMMYINELFSKTKYKIIEANNGQEAIDLALQNPSINLVLMDIKMPIKNGKDAMKEIKAKKPNLPIVALSAFAMESDVESAIKDGFDAYLTKPIDRKKLFEILNKYL